MKFQDTTATFTDNLALLFDLFDFNQDLAVQGLVGKSMAFPSVCEPKTKYCFGDFIV